MTIELVIINAVLALLGNRSSSVTLYVKSYYVSGASWRHLPH